MVATITGTTPHNTAVPSYKTSRACLRCQQSFESSWAGERVCPKCKNTTSWKEGSIKRHGAVNPQRNGR